MPPYGAATSPCHLPAATTTAAATTPISFQFLFVEFHSAVLLIKGHVPLRHSRTPQRSLFAQDVDAFDGKVRRNGL